MITLTRSASGVRRAADWPRLGAEDTLPPRGPVLVSLDRWRTEVAPTALAEAGPVGLWLDGSADLAAWTGMEADLKRLPMIALAFPVFTDGRAYSIARRLRRAGYTGPLMAFGDVLVDQLRAMVRVGFTQFEVADDFDPRAADAALSAFPAAYQAAADDAPSLALRRQGRVAEQRSLAE